MESARLAPQRLSNSPKLAGGKESVLSAGPISLAVEQPFRERELVSVCLSRKRHWDAMKRFGFAPRDRMWPREVGEHQAERGRCLVAGSSPPLGSSPPGSLGWPRANEANVNLSGTAAQEIAATSSVDDRLRMDNDSNNNDDNNENTRRIRTRCQAPFLAFCKY